jgi:hypothetical protein
LLRVKGTKIRTRPGVLHKHAAGRQDHGEHYASPKKPATQDAAQ